MTPDLWLHTVEIVILLFGVAAPITYSVIRLRVILKEFPPHRHLNGKVIYPVDYAPSKLESIGADK